MFATVVLVVNGFACQQSVYGLSKQYKVNIYIIAVEYGNKAILMENS
jgi:hypothetical protein